MACRKLDVHDWI